MESRFDRELSTRESTRSAFSLGEYGRGRNVGREFDRTDDSEISQREDAKAQLGLGGRRFESRTVEQPAQEDLYGRPVDYSAAPAIEETPSQSRLFFDRVYDRETVTRNDVIIGDADLAPSDKTMFYRDRAYDMDSAQQTVSHVQAVRKPMTRKQKIAVAIYSCITVVIAALIIVTGAMIGTISKNVSALKSEAGDAQVRYEQSADRLSNVESDAYIREKALENGMTDGGTAIRLTLIPDSELATYTAPTNGFDKFCDWLTRVFG